MPNVQADSIRPLIDSLREHIARAGPMPVDHYMRACLADPQRGYWQRTATIGAGGDFITAPEISQVFGELIGVWSIVTWERMGRPSPLRLVELGPGRGTLMHDALRAARAMPQFGEAATVHLVEVSASLRDAQRRTLLSPTPARKADDNQPAISWHSGLDDVPPGAAIIVGNEFLDALPVRQLIYQSGVWRERVVELAAEGHLQFAAGPAVAFQGAMQPQPTDGAIVELRSGEEDVVRTLAARADPCVTLFIDYGPAEPSFGDTLQAVRRHAYADTLADPGTADLTTHVQFAGLAEKARAAGLSPWGPITQAEFLGRLGIVERTQRLMGANPGRAGEIETAVQRLISPNGMGGLFKAIAISAPALPAPLPFG